MTTDPTAVTTAKDSATIRPNPVDPALPDPIYYAEGKDVVAVLQKLTGVGDGLSKAMASDRVPRAQGTRGYMIVEVELDKVQVAPHRGKGGADTTALDRVEQWRGIAMTFVEDAPAARKAIVEQKRRNELEAERRAGIMRLFEEQQALEAEAAAEADEADDE